MKPFINKIILTIVLAGGALLLWRFYGAPTAVSDKTTLMAGMEGMPGMAMPGPETNKAAQAMNEMPGMGVNETGQATVMLSPAQAKSLDVRLITVGLSPIRRTIRVSGRVVQDERRRATVNPRVEGWIRNVRANVTGGRVEKGAPLLTLYSPMLRSEEREYLLAEKSTLRQHPSDDIRKTADALLSGASARLRRLQVTEREIAALAARGEATGEVALVAPMAGQILRHDVALGMWVTPEMTLYEIADLSTVWVLADVPERYLAAIAIGTEADVTLAGDAAAPIHAKVTFISPVLQTDTRTAQVRIESPDGALKPGMSAEVVFHPDAGSGLVVPESAVLDTGLRKIVFIDRGMTMYEPKEIQATRADDTYVVTVGLNAGDQIVRSAHFLIDSESKLMASTNMMGALGMGGVAMEQARMGEMEMEGMSMVPAATPTTISETGVVTLDGLTLTLSTDPAPAKKGKNTLRLSIADAAGKRIENAQVTFLYIMPMPGMTEEKAQATWRDGGYETPVLFSMGGVWHVTVAVAIPGHAPIRQTFEVIAQWA